MTARIIFSLLLFAAFQFSIVSPAFAQKSDRQEFIEGLFRTIIESRSQRDQDPNRPSVQPPTVTVPPSIPPGSPPQSMPKERKTYQNQIAGFANETTRLVNQLGQESMKNPNLRAYLPELYNIRSQATLLHQQSQAVQNPGAVQVEFQSLDNSWRNLSHRLRSDSQLSKPIQDSISRIDSHRNELSALIGTQADFDRIRATVLAAQASAYIDSLLDVIQHELFDQPNCDALLQEGRQQKALAEQFASSVNRFSMNEAVGAFEQWSISWRQFGAKLHAFHNPELARAVGRVGRSQGELYDLMRIERPVDYGYIHYLSGQCGFAVRDLFAKFSIPTLAALSQPQLTAVFRAQQTLPGQFDQLCDAVSGTPNANEVVKQFLMLEKAWNSCDGVLAGLPGDVASYRSTINNHITEIRCQLQIHEQLDRGKALSQAASIQGMAQNLFNHLVAVAGYIPNRQLRSQSLVRSQEFLNQAQNFHAQVATGQDFATLQNSCGNLIDSWQGCSEAIQALSRSGVDQRIYRPIELARSQIDPSVAELGIVLAP